MTRASIATRDSAHAAVGLTPDHEPPRKSSAVNAIMALTGGWVGRGVQTPHMSGGSPAEKILFEYRSTPDFIDRMGEFVDLERILPGATVLDVGCGWGGKTVYYAERLRTGRIHGFDLPGVWLPHAIEFAASMGVSDRCFFSCTRAEKMPFDDESFDVLICEDVLEHVEDPRSVLSECRRVLEPGGILIAKFPSFKSLTAHHLDRALSLPGVHFVLPMRTLAGGLNWLRLNRSDAYAFEPFRAVIRTSYGSVTSDLNGIGFGDFSQIVREGGWQIDTLMLVPARNFGGRRSFKVAAPLYKVLWSLPFFREAMSSFVLLVARKEPGRST